MDLVSVLIRVIVAGLGIKNDRLLLGESSLTREGDALPGALHTQ